MENKVDFNLILEQISKYAFCDHSKTKILNLTLNNDLKKAQEDLSYTNDARIICTKYGQVEMDNLNDLKTVFKKIKIEADLNIEDFMHVYNHFILIKNTKVFFKKNEVKTKFSDIVYNLILVEKYIEKLQKTFRYDGYILDTASDELTNLRKTINTRELGITKYLNNYIKNNASYLSDSIYTRRNDRFVILIKAEYKNKLNGIIHQESSSGSSYYFEPKELFELNNELTMLKEKEIKEISKILHKLSKNTYEIFEILKSNIEKLLFIDYFFALGYYSHLIEGVIPEFKEDYNLIKAKHPLIPKSKVVANDIKCFSKKGFILSGANTGGKTVTLKMIALFSLMAQNGILIPVEEGSYLPFYQNIFIDIGDLQSIENNLSTFSAHFTNISNILKNLSSNSLVIFDELGSGTDPKEGEAIAYAIIEHCIEKDVFFVCTTHFTNLKRELGKKDIIQKIAVEFDELTLLPTYRLIYDVDGYSNALSIASFLGIDDKIIKKANLYLEKNYSSELLLKDIEEEKQNVLKEKEKYLELIKNEEKRNEELEKKIFEFTKSKKDFYDQKDVILNEYVKEKKQEIDEKILEISESSKVHELVKLKKSIEVNKLDLDVKINITNNDFLEVNDEVVVYPFEQRGKIKNKLKNNFFEIQIGNSLMKVKKENLEFFRKPEKIKTTHVVPKKNNATSVLDLRGVRKNEVVYELESFINQMILNNLTQGQVIHGFGTGVVRLEVQEFLKKNKFIKSYRYGGANEGGNGSTYFELK